MIGHTFTRKDQRCYRVVIKNLHHSTPHSAIQDEIEKTGNKISGEIINARFGPDKMPTSTFFVNIAPGPNNKAVKEIKVIHHQAVTIEDPKKRKTIPQCQRCQQYGHSKNYCMRPYRCVKCGEGHRTADCPKTDRNTPAKCALCEGDHPANYKGCDVYREILQRRLKTNPNRRTNQVTFNSELATRRPKMGPSQNPQPETPNPDQIPNNKKTYSETLREPFQKKHIEKPCQTNASTTEALENIIAKQTQKIDILLQHISTLLGLITTLVTKMSR